MLYLCCVYRAELLVLLLLLSMDMQQNVWITYSPCTYVCIWKVCNSYSWSTCIHRKPAHNQYFPCTINMQLYDTQILHVLHSAQRNSGLFVFRTQKKKGISFLDCRYAVDMKYTTVGTDKIENLFINQNFVIVSPNYFLQICHQSSIFGTNQDCTLRPFGTQKL